LKEPVAAPEAGRRGLRGRRGILVKLKTETLKERMLFKTPESDGIVRNLGAA
jgi:hypothetical protein